MKLSLSKYNEILNVKDTYTKSLIKVYSIITDTPIEECLTLPMSKVRETINSLKYYLKMEIEPFYEDRYLSLFKRSLSDYITLEDLIKKNKVKEIVDFSYTRPVPDEYESIWAYRKMLEERETLLNSFPNIFNHDTFDYEEEIEKVEDIKDKKVIMEERQKEKFRQTYNFDLLLLYLSNNDISKINTILEMNIVQIFRLMVVKHEYDQIK